MPGEWQSNSRRALKQIDAKAPAPMF